MTASAIERLDELISGFETAMLVTRSVDGGLRARPMAIAKHADGGALYFTSRAEDEKLEEILQSPDVAVTMQGKDRYLSISGTTRLLTDQLLADDLWSESMRLWFPDGAADTQLTVILLEPTYGEYWDRTGLRRLEFLWEAGKALLKNQKASDESLGGHRKIRVGGRD
jgi:general stress protein 26